MHRTGCNNGRTVSANRPHRPLVCFSRILCTAVAPEGNEPAQQTENEDTERTGELPGQDHCSAVSTPHFTCTRHSHDTFPPCMHPVVGNKCLRATVAAPRVGAGSWRDLPVVTTRLPAYSAEHTRTHKHAPSLCIRRRA